MVIVWTDRSAWALLMMGVTGGAACSDAGKAKASDKASIITGRRSFLVGLD
jgi:hypothetical protein